MHAVIRASSVIRYGRIVIGHGRLKGSLFAGAHFSRLRAYVTARRRAQCALADNNGHGRHPDRPKIRPSRAVSIPKRARSTSCANKRPSLGDRTAATAEECGQRTVIGQHLPPAASGARGLHLMDKCARRVLHSEDIGLRSSIANPIVHQPRTPRRLITVGR